MSQTTVFMPLINVYRADNGAQIVLADPNTEALRNFVWSRGRQLPVILFAPNGADYRQLVTVNYESGRLYIDDPAHEPTNPWPWAVKAVEYGSVRGGNYISGGHVHSYAPYMEVSSGHIEWFGVEYRRVLNAPTSGTFTFAEVPQLFGTIFVFTGRMESDWTGARTERPYIQIRVERDRFDVSRQASGYRFFIGPAGGELKERRVLSVSDAMGRNPLERLNVEGGLLDINLREKDGTLSANAQWSPYELRASVRNMSLAPLEVVQANDEAEAAKWAKQSAQEATRRAGLTQDQRDAEDAAQEEYDEWFRRQLF